MSKLIKFLAGLFLFLGFLAFAPKASASYVASDLLGQLDGDGNPVYITSSTGSSTTTMRNAYDVKLDAVNNRLFVLDRGNNRVLVFNMNDNDDLEDHLPDYVLGQTNFTNNSATTSQNGLNVPYAIEYDPVGNRLFVAELSSNRVVIFDVASITNGENAVNVLGQSDFVTKVATVTPSGFNLPTGVTYVTSTQYLFVSDWNNDRVLVFDLSTITNGEDAIYVLGQDNFTSRNGTTTQSGLDGPYNTFFDPTNSILYVSDYNNFRIVTYDVSTISNGESAVNVLGQANFVSKVSATTQSGMKQPIGVGFDSLKRRFIVFDMSNQRVLFYDVTSISDGEDAVSILGQDDYTSAVRTTTQSGFNDPARGFFDVTNRRLYVADVTNSRVIIFNFVRLSTSTLATANTNIDYSQSITSTNYQGTLSYSVLSGSLPSGLSLNSSTGAITGAPTLPGTYTFTINATDTLSVGSFADQREYSITVENAVPTISSISPSVGYAETTNSFTLTVSGTGFVTSSAIQVDGVAKTTTYVSPTELRTQFGRVSDVGSVGDHNISVNNPAPGGGTSTSSVFSVSITSVGVSGSGVAIPVNFSAPTPPAAATITPVVTAMPTKPAEENIISSPEIKTIDIKSSLLIPPSFVFKPNLGLGTRRADVVYLQRYLKSLGSSIYPEGLVTGYYGPLTFRAVKRLQAKNNIPATGFFGPLTRAFVNNILK